MSSLIKSKQEIETIAEGGRLLAGVLRATAKLARAGVSTWELNEFAERKIFELGGRPSFKNHGPKKNPFPAGLCTSVNEVVVHGIPSKTVILKEGDIIGLDIGMEYKGLYTDMAVTVAVGKIAPRIKELLEVTKKSLQIGIELLRPGVKTGDLGAEIQKIVEAAGFGVVRDLIGHGVGYAVHEDPAVPNYGPKGSGVTLKEGMVIAVEPMVTLGDWQIAIEDDQWTVTTLDYSLAAHFEHTVAITHNGARILTL